MTPVKPPEDGWHWTEWWAELTGTAVLLFAIVTARYWAIRGGPPWSDPAITIAIIGMAAGLAVLGVAVSPLGRRSGAHLNPAVTIGLWLQKVTSRADLAGYCTAQIAGGIAGVVAARAWGAQVARPPVHWAVIAPAAWMPPAAAAGIEAAATSVQLLLLYAALASSRHHQWAPHVACCMLTVFIIAVAPLSGGGFSPVRGLAPDLMAGTYPALWIYFVGPVVGSAAAAAAILAWRWRPITGKLRHDAAIMCHMRCELPHRVKAPAQTNGTGAAHNG
ncbi:MAG TPA: aquaporin [Streptosporangiaceae bacterium]